MPKTESGFLSEFFFSYQGEGSWVGCPQAFLRFSGCREKCRYCDTPRAREEFPKTWTLAIPGRAPRTLKNPVPPAGLVKILSRFLPQCGPIHSLVFTGGEPLEQAGFLREVLVLFQKQPFRPKLFLETNGLTPADPDWISRNFAYVSLDLKLPSACGFKGRPLGQAAWQKSLRPGAGCWKAVVTPATREAEVAAAARLARRLQPEWDFILQPATGHDWRSARSGKKLALLAQSARKENLQMRLIPQIHPLLGIR